MERVLVAEPMADSYVQLRDDLHVESRYGKLDAEDMISIIRFLAQGTYHSANLSELLPVFN